MNTTAIRKRWCATAIVLLALAGCSSGSGGGGTTVVFVPNFGAAAVRVNDMPGASDGNDAGICCVGLNVYVAWEDDRNDPGGNRDIFFNYSRDGGVTWQANDIRLDTDVAGAAMSRDSEICCAGQRIYVVWEDDRNDVGANRDIFFNYSDDGGVTWQASDIRLDTDALGAGDSVEPEICCDGLNVYVAWEDNRNDLIDDDEDIFFNFSADGGVTWQVNDTRLDTDAVNEDSDTLSICCQGLNVYVVWEDNRNGNADLFLNYSNDGGATFQPNDIRIDTGNAAGSTTADSPKICCDGLRIYVVWRDNRFEPAPGPPPRNDILGNYSFDGGATWQPNSFLVDNGSANSELPRICCDGLNVYVVWRDDRDDLGGNEDVYFNYSRNGGITWQATDIRLDTGDPPGASDIAGLRICCAGSNIYVCWHDDRDALGGNEDIYFNFSTDAGVSWQATDIRLDGGDVAGANDSEGVQICCDGLHVYVVWEDNRNDPGTGNENIFVNGSSP